MTRTIPATLAPLLETLEIDRPSLLTFDQLAGRVAELGMSTPARHAVYELRKRGWLLYSGVPGVYEFAPADRAGSFSDEDSLLALRAVVLDSPDLPVAAALGSALALLNVTDRGPDKPEVALPTGVVAPLALSRACRVVRFRAVLPLVKIGGVPVHCAATVLVHLAHRPTAVRSWGAMLDSLADIVAAAPEQEVIAELASRPHATKVRLAYLVSGIAPGLAAAIDVRPAGKVWFGPRRTLRRHNARWNIADTILPLAPSELAGRAR